MQLLDLLQQERDLSIWDGHDDLLAWLLFIGGAFAPAGRVRMGFVQLVQHSHSSKLARLSQSWDATVETLKQFIWSEKAYHSQVGTFWEETKFQSQ